VRGKSHIANAISFFRIGCVPFIIFFIFKPGPQAGITALALFLTASISDWLDGYISRKLKTQSEFGVFIDPLADKIVTGGVFLSIALIPEIGVPLWIILIIIIREIFLTLFRIIALRRGKQFKTEYSGKIKTFFQMCTITLILIQLYFYKYLIWHYPERAMVEIKRFWIELAGQSKGSLLYRLPVILVSISAGLAMYSMVEYIVRNRHIFSFFKKLYSKK